MTATPKFQKGDNVKIISNGNIGTVNEVLVRENNIGYRVTTNGRTSTYQEKYLERFVDEEQEIMDALALQEYAGQDEFHLFQTWFRLKRPIEGNFYSYLASRTVFNPYQFKPLSKFTSSGSEERLFIADEVGVGKTIETGIILTELVARGRLDRRTPILIVCPNVLGPKWVKEMSQRFRLNFHLHDGKSLETALKSALNGYIPDQYVWSVASIQLLRHKSYLNLLYQLYASREAPLWSLTVVDEAHHMRNISTESNVLGNLLSSLTDMMILLSATPLNLKDEDLFNQMHILNPSMFPDLQTFCAMLSPVKSINKIRRLLAEKTHTVYGEILEELDNLESGPLGEAIAAHPGVKALRQNSSSGHNLSNIDVARYDRMLISLSPLDSCFTRTLKREAIGHRVTREAIRVPVELTPAEVEFHEAVVELVSDAYLARGGNPVALGFITNMPRRMVSSCIPAMRQYLDWCLKNDQVIVDEMDVSESVDDDSELEKVPLTPELRERFALLRDQAEALGQVDTKFKQFIALVEQLTKQLENPQIIVFSFFVRTLRYLKDKLERAGYRVGLVCGDVPLVSDGKQPGRYEIMDAFADKKLDILLSSEVGGEGLDFQFCQALVNYDLPYNPMKVEQRIGRIDRFGQTAEKVFVASMYIKDTLDEDIYTALYDRIKLVEDSVGALEPILGDTLTDLQKEIINGQLTQDQIAARTREIELAVEQARMELERFESSRRELMGDEYFTSPLHNLESHNEFVRPSDAARLTAICLSLWHGCGYEAIDQDRGQMVLSKDVFGRLEQYTRRPGSEGSMDELSPLLKSDLQIPVVFNGSLADQYRDYHFIPPCGFWTKFLLTELESQNQLRRVFSFATRDKDLELATGEYLVSLFEVKLEGFRVELDLAAIPVRLSDRTMPECDYSKLSRKIGRNIADNVTRISPIDEVEDFVDLSREALEQQLEEKMDLLRTENRYRTEARINSLNKGAEVRIERLRRRILEHRERAIADGKEPSIEFIRMTEAQISIEERRRDTMVEKLSAKSELSLTLSLVAVIALEVYTD